MYFFVVSEHAVLEHSGLDHKQRHVRQCKESGGGGGVRYGCWCWAVAAVERRLKFYRLLLRAYYISEFLLPPAVPSGGELSVPPCSFQ